MSSFIKYLDQFYDVLAKTSASDHSGSTVELDTAMDSIVQQLQTVREKRNTVYLVGNGGSSGIVSHGAIDFLNACSFKAQALTDNSQLTCLANDYGYENVFAQALKTVIEPNDVLIAISSSGNSANIVKACEIAREKGAFIIGFSGFSSDNKLKALGDFNLWVNDNHYGRVEIGHSLLLHSITDQLAVK